MATDLERDDALLDSMLQVARAAPPQPSEALLARVMADAEAVLATRAAAPAVPAVRRGGGWLGRMAEALGGWGAVGGLVTASGAGLWLGLSGVAGVPGGALQWPAALIGGVAMDVMPDTYTVLSQVSEE